MSSLDPVVHVAGPMAADGLQLCARCGCVLTDYRGSMVPSEDATKPLRGWRPGAHVEVSYYGAARFSDLVEKPADCTNQRKQK